MIINMANEKNLPEISYEETKMLNGIEQKKIHIKVTGENSEKCFKQFKKVKEYNHGR